MAFLLNTKMYFVDIVQPDELELDRISLANDKEEIK